MSPKHLILILLLSSPVFAIAQQNKTQDQIEEFLNNNAGKWIYSWESFGPLEFNKSSDMAIDTAPAIDLTLFERCLVYSPDKSHLIDIYSYNMVLEVVNGDTLATFDVDAEASLINQKTGKKIRLLFLGSTSSLDDAFWMDNSNLIIVGSEQTASGSYTPLVWHFNLTDKKKNLYVSPQTKPEGADYFTQKFPWIKFE